jgi:hypothetical protein
MNYCADIHHSNKMGLGFIGDCLLTFYTTENVKQFIEYQLEHWNELEHWTAYEHNHHVRTIFCANSLVNSTYYEAFCFILIDRLENWGVHHDRDVSYFIGTMRDFEYLCDHQQFIQHVSAFSKLSINEQNLKVNEQQKFCGRVEKKCSATGFYRHLQCEKDVICKAVDKFILDDYLCGEHNIRQFVSYVLENNDSIGLYTLNLCDAHIKFNHPSFYKCLCDVFIERIEHEYECCKIIMLLCNTIPYTRYATEWKRQKQSLLASICEQVFDTYEAGNVANSVLCNDYIISQIANFF